MKKNINTTIQWLAVGIFSISLTLVSCKKEGCTDPAATNYSEEADEDDGSCEYAQAAEPESYTPTYSGEYALLASIKTVSTQSTPVGNVDTEVGTAVAAFSQDGGSNFVDAGTVSVETKNLEKQDNNAYTFTDISQSNPTGISFSTPIDWEISGGTWAAFTASTNKDFPTVAEINEEEVSSGSDFTLSVNNITDADSVVFAVYGTNDYALIIKAGNTTSHTFSASELNNIGEGNGFIQVTGVVYDQQTINGKAVYLVNETVRTKSVMIEP